MKNYEKYAEEIKNYYGDNFCKDFIRPKIMKINPEACCVSDCGHCGMRQFIWLMEEYEEPKEPEVDWSKVAVDTPILVRDSKEDDWKKRHFAEYIYGTVYGWSSGMTSWSARGGFESVPYIYAKLAETEGEK